MKKSFSTLLSLSLILMGSCGEQQTTAIPQVSQDVPYTGSVQQKEKFIADACANTGGDNDKDGICDNNEIDLSKRLGVDCTKTADCDNNGVTDGDEPKNWFMKPWNMVMLTLGTAVLGAASLGVLEVIDAAKTPRKHIAATTGPSPQSTEISMDGLQAKESKQIFKKEADGLNYVTQIARSQVGKTTFGGVSIEGNILVCQKSYLNGSDIYQNTPYEKYHLYLNTNYSTLYNSKIIPESALNNLCEKSVQSIFFVAVELAEKGLYEITMLTPEAFGYAQTANINHFRARQETILKYSDLMSTPIGMQWQDHTGKKSNLHFTKATPSGSTSEKMKALLDNAIFQLNFQQSDSVVNIENDCGYPGCG